MADQESEVEEAESESCEVCRHRWPIVVLFVAGFLMIFFVGYFGFRSKLQLEEIELQKARIVDSETQRQYFVAKESAELAFRKEKYNATLEFCKWAMSNNKNPNASNNCRLPE